MTNPFEKRATEYLREDEAFLPVVTPEPLMTFFRKPAQEDRLLRSFDHDNWNAWEWENNFISSFFVSNNQNASPQ